MPDQKLESPFLGLKTAILPPFSLQLLQPLCFSRCNYCNHCAARFCGIFIRRWSSITALKCTTAPQAAHFLPHLLHLFHFSICPVSDPGGNDRYQSTRLPGSLSRWKAPPFTRFQPLSRLPQIILIQSIPMLP